jgi:hypothetical protein
VEMSASDELQNVAVAPLLTKLLLTILTLVLLVVSIYLYSVPNVVTVSI